MSKTVTTTRPVMTASPVKCFSRQSLDLDDLFVSESTYGVDDRDAECAKSVSHLSAAYRKYQQQSAGGESGTDSGGELDGLARSAATGSRSQGRRGRKKRVTSMSSSSIVSNNTPSTRSGAVNVAETGTGTSFPSLFAGEASSSLIQFLSYNDDNDSEPVKLASNEPPSASGRQRRRSLERCMSSSASLPPVPTSNKHATGVVVNNNSILGAADRLKLRERLQKERSVRVDKRIGSSRTSSFIGESRPSASSTATFTSRTTPSLDLGKNNNSKSGFDGKSSALSYRTQTDAPRRHQSHSDTTENDLIPRGSSSQRRRGSKSPYHERRHHQSSGSHESRGDHQQKAGQSRDRHSGHQRRGTTSEASSTRKGSKSPFHERRGDQQPTAEHSKHQKHGASSEKSSSTRRGSKSPYHGRRHRETYIDQEYRSDGYMKSEQSRDRHTRESDSSVLQKSPLPREAPSRGRSDRRPQSSRSVSRTRSAKLNQSQPLNYHQQQRASSKNSKVCRRHSNHSAKVTAATQSQAQDFESTSCHSLKPDLSNDLPQTAFEDFSSLELNTSKEEPYIPSGIISPLEVCQDQFNAFGNFDNSLSNLNAVYGNRNTSQSKLDVSHGRLSSSFGHLNSSGTILNGSKSAFNSSFSFLKSLSNHSDKGTKATVKTDFSESTQEREKSSETLKVSHQRSSSRSLRRRHAASAALSPSDHSPAPQLNLSSHSNNGNAVVSVFKKQSSPSIKDNAATYRNGRSISPTTQQKAINDTRNTTSNTLGYSNSPQRFSNKHHERSTDERTRSPRFYSQNSDRNDEEDTEVGNDAFIDNTACTVGSGIEQISSRPFYGVKEPSLAKVNVGLEGHSTPHQQRSQFSSLLNFTEADTSLMDHTAYSKGNQSEVADGLEASQSTCDIIDNSSDEEDDDDYVNNESDQDTVLQFDPTHSENVYRVRQVTRETSSYNIQRSDGTVVEGQIAEIDDPIGDAQSLQREQNDPSSKPKKSIFDFLNDDTADAGVEVEPFDEPSLIAGRNETEEVNDESEEFDVESTVHEASYSNFVATDKCYLSGGEEYEGDATVYGYGEDVGALNWNDASFPSLEANSSQKWAQGTINNPDFADTEIDKDNEFDWGKSFNFDNDNEAANLVQPTPAVTVKTDVFDNADEGIFDDTMSPIPAQGEESPQPKKLVRKVRKKKVLKKEQRKEAGGVAVPDTGAKSPHVSDKHDGQATLKVVKKKKRPENTVKSSTSAIINEKQESHDSKTESWVSDTNYDLGDVKLYSRTCKEEQKSTQAMESLPPSSTVNNTLSNSAENERSKQSGDPNNQPNPRHVPSSSETLSDAAHHPSKGKKGIGLGSIGRYFGRNHRSSPAHIGTIDGDDASLGAGSVATRLFRGGKKHQLLGDDDSYDSVGQFG